MSVWKVRLGGKRCHIVLSPEATCSAGPLLARAVQSVAIAKSDRGTEIA